VPLTFTSEIVASSRLVKIPVNNELLFLANLSLLIVKSVANVGASFQVVI